MPTSYPTVSLTPGSTGDAVKQLQDFLVSQGYMTQAEVNTGYGTYGPKTTLAVQKLQQSLGVDNSSGPGYWGPKTLAAIEGKHSTPAQPTSKPATPTPAPVQNNQQQTDILQSKIDDLKKQADVLKANNLTDTSQIKKDSSGNYVPINSPITAPATPVIDSTNTDTTWLTSIPEFQNLPTDMQNYLKQYYQILKTGDSNSQKLLSDALTQAKAQADPYWEEVINQAKDQLSRDLLGQEADYATKEKTLTDNITRIKEDLAVKKGDISIDQQAELTRQAKKYQNDLDTLRENASSTGLTFSSKRNQAENQLANSNTDIVESTKLNYMRQSRDLETAALRGEADAIAKIAEYKRILGENEMSTLRGTESKIGSENLPNLPDLLGGAIPAGGITGSFTEDKIKDIWTRAEALAGLGNPFIK